MKKFILTGIAALTIAGFSTVTKAAPVGDMDVDISGLAQISASFTEQNANIGSGNDTIDINRLRINLSAMPAEKIKLYAALEGTSNISGTAKGAAGAPNVMYDTPNEVPTDNDIADTLLNMDGVADSRLVDLYADISYVDWVSLRVGQFPLPISYELNTPEFDLETINYTMAAGIFGKRDRGFVLSGSPVPDVLKLSLAVTNGNGAITGASNDDDDLSNFALQVDWKIIPGLSGKLWGAWAQDSIQTNGIAVVNSNNDTDAFGLGVDYKYEGFHLSAEYNDASIKVNPATLAANTSDDQDITEWNLTLGYTIPETGVQLVARYDTLDFDDTTVAGAVKTNTQIVDTDVITAGVNWNFEKNAKLQIMREFVEGSDNDNLDILLSLKF